MSSVERKIRSLSQEDFTTKGELQNIMFALFFSPEHCSALTDIYNTFIFQNYSCDS